MAASKKKHAKHVEHEEKKASEAPKKNINVTSEFLGEIKDAFVKFDKIPEEKRVELYGQQEYLEQFREYFKKEYPSLLDKVDKERLPIYIEEIQKKGFSIGNIATNAIKLHEEFQSDDTEIHVMEKSISDLKKFCDDDINHIPSGTFKKFADAAGFDADTLTLSPEGKLKTIDDLYSVRKRFLENENIKLKPVTASHAERIMMPKYNPTERLMVKIAIKKISGELSGPLKKSFDTQFTAPDIFSSYQDLVSFRLEWSQFLADHASQIDKDLAKKLDNLIVSNGDIQNELLHLQGRVDTTRWFSEREQYYRSLFNAFVTRQLFEEIQKTQESIDNYVDAMADTFKKFPPYLNTILRIHRFDVTAISAVDPTFNADLHMIETKMSEIEEQIPTASDDERKTLRKQLKELSQQREQRRRQAYVALLKSKDASLGDAFDALVRSKFDFSVLSPDIQQHFVNTLVKQQLNDTIKNKVPELLALDTKELTAFVDDLFNLKKMDLTIPTRYGDVNLTFLKKEFMSTVHDKLPAIEGLAEKDIKNIPLNFLVQLNQHNAPFFEDSVIFRSLFTPFVAKNGTFNLNDAYKVSVKKDGKTVVWYLSSYAPLDEYNKEKEGGGKELYLYSQPVTAPDQTRTLVTRDGQPGGTPVVIKDEEQKDCDIDIIEKNINLNGEALGALLFGYVLGKESMARSLPPEKEKELAEKFGKLNVFKEKADEEEPEEEQPSGKEQQEEKKESPEQEKFMNERGQLAWYDFPDPPYKDKWFVEGTRLFIPFADSMVLPQNTWRARLQLEITKINRKKWTFLVKVHGGEVRLWSTEGKTTELAMNVSTFANLRKHFWSKICKLPDISKHSVQERMDILISTKTADGLEHSFGKVKYDWGRFTFSLGEEIGQEVEHFWRYEEKIGENPDVEWGKRMLYKVKHNPNNTFTITADYKNEKWEKETYRREMDYPTFLLFVTEKKLQPKSKKQSENIQKKQDLESNETPTTVRGFSINNVMGFFKNSFTRLKDNIKKFDEERTEDLTDLVTDEGRLYSRIGSILPFTRVATWFETLGAEYYLERDNRIRKKVEKRLKFYEDHHFPTIYNMYLKPLLQGWEKPVPHYKMAALLLAMIKKGPGPYRANPDMVGKGQWINILLWPEHQARYLAMRDKRFRELEQNSASYPSTRTDQMRNELMELEMKYIVHVVDGRQLWLSWVDGWAAEKYFCSKYSRKFAGELEGAYTDYFKQESVEGSYNKIPKTTNFEFARFEYFRLLNDRPQKAIPYLKVMAEKAYTTAQRQTFEYAVMVGMLSWVFINMTFSDTASFIQKICRTRGFLPWLRVRDYYQQTKLARLLDIFSKGDFSNKTKYKQSNFSFGNMKWIGELLDEKKCNFKWRFDANGAKFSEFMQMTWKSSTDETLVEMFSNPKTSAEDKMLLNEIIKKSMEKDEDIDPTVKYNPGSLKTSVFTKSQSVVQELMKCKNGVFDGKDKDENQSMQSFRQEVAEKLPTKSLEKETVAYYLEKFLNRFEERGFTASNKGIFLRRLQTVNKLISLNREKEATDVLRYSIVGTIIKSLHGSAPQELKNGLEAFMKFFKANLSAILDPVMVKGVFGIQYVEDSKKPYETGSRHEYIDTLPINSGNIGGAEGKQKNIIRKKYVNTEVYYHKDLYRLADDLFRNAGESNRFNNYYTIEKKAEGGKWRTPVPHKATGAKIKNPEVIEKVKRILEGKPAEEDTSEWWYSFPMGGDDGGYGDMDDYGMAV